MKKSIVEFEDRIDEAKNQYLEALALTLKLLKENPSIEEISANATNTHQKAVRYFNLFERSVSEYGLDEYQLNEDKRVSKMEDAVSIAKLILSHWKLMEELKIQYPEITAPRPTALAYSNIQSLLSNYLKRGNEGKRREVERIKQELINAKLPIDGFIDPHPFMTKKQQITYSIIVGTIFLVALIGLAIFIQCPTSSQSKIFSVVLSLAAASYAASIPGFLNVRFGAAVTAGGALGVFVIVFFWSPADIKDFTECPPTTFAGTLYFGDSPIGEAQIRLIRQNQITETNSSGNFNFQVNTTSDTELRLRVIKVDIDLDTVLTIKTADLKPFNDLVVRKYCITCEHLSSDNITIGVKKACAGSADYINGFEKGFTKKGNEQGLTTRCIKTLSPS